MIDRKNTIINLETNIRWIEDTECHQFSGWGNVAMAMRDALELLKEQEAKTGTWQWKIHGKAESGGTLGEAICDQCGKSTYATAVKGDLNYCPNCGAKMTDRKQ